MNTTGFTSYINRQLATGNYPSWSQPDQVRHAVTISRQAGCGAQEIAGKLAARLLARHPDGGCPWTVCDRDLLVELSGDQRLPKYLASYLPEYRKPLVENILEDIFGRHPGQPASIKQTTRAVLGLAEVGNVILIGRAGNIITAEVPHVLHVRLVAPLDVRIDHALHIYGLSPLEARNFCLREDLGRERYLYKNFDADINDPLSYHLVINTALTSYDATAKLIEDALFNLDTLPGCPEHCVTTGIEASL